MQPFQCSNSEARALPILFSRISDKEERKLLISIRGECKKRPKMGYRSLGYL